ncbi:MAG: FecR family protein [Pseudobacter sp.]|uniref:FecR family protein n=1 Tax=Pseudobacter sp. TaxID=2045420 RepID=UPI003F7CEFF4
MQDISLLIQKSLNGSATAAELKQLLDLLQQEENALYGEWMQMQDQAATLSTQYMPAFNKQGVKDRISQTIQETNPAPVVNISLYRKVLPYSGPAAVAAVAVLCLLLAARFLFPKNEGVSIRPELPALAVSMPAIIEAGNEQKTIVLRDSSVVLLYAGSSLQYEKDYNVNGRKLYLKGKGRFTVKKQELQPFTVYSKFVSTTALGTVFEIQESADSTVVSLIEGKVKVEDYSSSSKGAVYLHAGQQATGFREANIAVAAIQREPVAVQKNNPKKTAQDKDADMLTFRQTSLINVFETLTEKYKVQIRFDKKEVSGILFTGNFGADETVADILQVIASINKLEVHSDHQGFTVGK